MNTEIDWSQQVFSHDRKAFRSEVINGFLAEEPGMGKGELTSRYQYVVANFDNNRVYLQRPAQFNNGFDFTIHVSGINFNPTGRRTTRPTHHNILEDLRAKKSENEVLYEQLTKEIDLLFNCQSNQTNWATLHFNVGLSTPILLTCIKWLFVEQDVTYWNYSGRHMFYNAIRQI